MTDALVLGYTLDEIDQLLADATDEQAATIGAALRLELLESDWRTWLTTLFPDYFGMDFAEHHCAFWNWLWAIDERAPAPFVGVWPRGGGKALAVDTPIPTPTGWTTMGDLAPGDLVFDHRGEPTVVIEASVASVQSAYRVDMGQSSIVASGDHRWAVLGRQARRDLPDERTDWATDAWAPRHERVCEVCGWPTRKGGLCSAHAERRRTGRPMDAPLTRHPLKNPPLRHADVLTTTDLLGDLWSGRERTWGIPTACALVLPEITLPIDPYVLGVWLGDGHTGAPRITSGYEDVDDMEQLLLARGVVLRRFNRPGAADLAIREFRGPLRAAGLLGHKHIPPAYLRASVEQRASLLRGLLDTDGSVCDHGSAAEFSSILPHLAAATAELARTLGYRVTVSEGRATLDGRDCGPVWRVRISGVDPKVFGLTRKIDKAAAHGPSMRWPGRMHYIDAVERVPDQMVRCIVVDSPGHLFLAGEDMIPTHNSSSAEAGVVALGALAKRRYVLWVCATQEQADKHVDTVAGLLESKRFGETYPDLSDRAVNKFGQAKGWRRNRLRTRSGFVIDAFGLDVAARGVKTDDARPDAMVFDDIDGQHDGPAEIERMIDDVTHKLMPAGADNLAVMAIQNLIHRDGVFARLVDGRADFLGGRILSGPIPAMHDLVTADRAGDTVIIEGTPSWVGQDAEVCQRFIDRWGISAFLAEAQHDVSAPPGGMFDHVTFAHCSRAEYDELRNTGRILDVVVWIDPAVTNKDTSDSQAAQLDAVGTDGTLYRVRSWEQRSSPLEAMKLGIRWGIDEGATRVGVETDQGGDTWRSVYQQALGELRGEGIVHDLTLVPSFDEAKAGSTQQSKAHRIATMLADYERANSGIVHVEGTHLVLENALRRFPKTKPYDLCLVAGTLILTDRGEVSIEDVQVGDLAMTRRGWRPVIKAGMTDDAAELWELRTAGGRSLRGTGQHPVWVQNQGWISLSAVRRGDIVLVWNDLAPISSASMAITTSDSSLDRRERRSRTSTGSSMCAIPIGATTRRLAAMLRTVTSFMSKCGRRLMVRSRQGSSSITSTTIPTTTTCPIWPASHMATIADSTELLRVLNAPAKSWMRRGGRRPRGIGARRVVHGIKSTADAHGLTVSIGGSSATNAGESSRHASLVEPRSALQSVATLPRRTTPTTTRTVSAPSAEKTFARGNGTNSGTAADRVLAVSRLETVGTVYALSVHDVREFFAEGILVHNCDASYWAWRYFRPEGAHSARSHASAIAAVGSLPTRGEIFAMGRRR